MFCFSEDVHAHAQCVGSGIKCFLLMSRTYRIEVRLVLIERLWLCTIHRIEIIAWQIDVVQAQVGSEEDLEVHQDGHHHLHFWRSGQMGFQ